MAAVQPPARKLKKPSGTRSKVLESPIAVSAFAIQTQNAVPPIALEVNCREAFAAGETRKSRVLTAESLPELFNVLA
ncbi:MAG TPA: hypothetical protein VGU90_11175, partial [Terriglobales bacterium]|nr:hypothetical protein [Terriglobales bacterium]